LTAAGHHDDDMERLASRIALIVSEGGEAENAGRAAGALARKLGLSGGDLKEIFLAGLQAEAAKRRRGSSGDLARENEVLRERAEVAEGAARQAQHERDILRAETRTYEAALQRRRHNDVITGAVGIAMVVVAIIGAGWFLVGPNRPSAASREATLGEAGGRVAVVRSGGANVRDQPVTEATIVLHLAAGRHVAVKRLVWKELLQWVEIDLGDHEGFVVTSEVDLLS
jgi:hypothetical protein